MEILKELVITMSKLVETYTKLGINTRATNHRVLESLFTPLASDCSTSFTMAPPSDENDVLKPPCEILYKELTKIKSVVDVQIEIITQEDAAMSLRGFAGNAASLYGKLKAYLMMSEEEKN